ncbi:Pho80p cyclin [Sporothrix curviconia]|uniref:Pho80p cyclin n=1 Tax=Sporothrix curviconia TaxID=1260050 RepID=A0ABP0APY3_9PEZI
MLTRSANASPVIHGFHYAPAHPSPRNSPSWNSAAATSAAAASSAARRPSSSSSPRVTGASAPLSGALSGAPAAAAASPSDRASVSAPSSPALSHFPLHARSSSLAFSRPQTPLAASLAGPQHLHHPLSRSPPRYVAVDAATQYSPMEPFDYANHPGHQHHLPHALDPSSSSAQPLSKQSTPRELPPTPGPIPMEPGIEQGVDHAATNGGAAPHSDGPALQGGRPAPGARVTASSASSATATATAPALTAASTSVSSSAGVPSSSLSSNRPTSASSTAPPPHQDASSSAQPQQPYTTSPQKRRISQQGPFSQQHDDANSEGAPSSEPRRLPSPSVADSLPAASKRARPEAAPVKMLPEQYELCAVEDMVVLIANMLGELIETNDALALKSGHLTRFHSRTPPGISVLDYLHRLAKHATLIPPLLLSMVYYIDRLCAMYPDFTINTLTVHRFLITAATVAAKGLSDSFWNNTTYARVGGVRVAELKMLELEFLYRLEWKIVPNPEVLAAYYRPLVERCPGYELPPDHSPSPDDDDDDDDMIDDADNEGDIGNGAGNDEPGAAGSGRAAPAHNGHNGHNRQSSTTLVDENMVVSGLTRQPTR